MPTLQIGHRGLVYALHRARDVGFDISVDTMSLEDGTIERRTDLDDAYLYAYGVQLLLETIQADAQAIYRISDVETRDQREIYRGPHPFGHILYATHFDYFLDGDGFYRLNLATGETRRLREADKGSERGFASYTEDYIVLLNSTRDLDAIDTVKPAERGLVIFSREAERLAQMPLPPNELVAPADRDQLQVLTQLGDKLFLYNPFVAPGAEPPLFYIELDAVVRGDKAEWQRATIERP